MQRMQQQNKLGVMRLKRQPVIQQHQTFVVMRLRKQPVMKPDAEEVAAKQAHRDEAKVSEGSRGCSSRAGSS